MSNGGAAEGALGHKRLGLSNGMGEHVVTGGPFTRVNLATGRHSCLDLFVVSRELVSYIDKLVIDSELKMHELYKIKMAII